MLSSGDMPEALFVDTDYKAMEVVAAIHDAGLRVPDDVALVSYDDVPEAATFGPTLTTVRVPLERKAELATSLLLDLIREPSRPSETIVLPVSLVYRASSGRRVMG